MIEGKMQFGVETVTPSMAEQWLVKSIGNRSLSAAAVLAQTKDMQDGLWHLTGDAIRFDEQGHLVDGHHRLTACVKAGVSFRTLVARGVTAAAMDVIDTGRSRTSADMFKMHGESNAAVKAAVCRLMIAIDGGFALDSPRFRAITRADMLHYVSLHRSAIEDAIVESLPLYETLGHTRAAWAVLCVLLHRVAPIGPVTEWIAGLASGADLALGDPRLAFRNRMLSFRDQGIRKGMNAAVCVAMGLKAWNCSIRGERRARMEVWSGTSATFPVPLSPQEPAPGVLN